MKLRFHGIDQLETYCYEKSTATSSVANTIKKFHIQSDLHLIYKKYFYNYKQREIDDIFIEYLVPAMEDLDHPALIEELKQNIDAAAYNFFVKNM